MSVGRVSSTGAGLLADAAAFAAAGALVGLELALGEIARQGYLELGFTRTPLRLAHQASTRGALSGGIAVLLFAAVRDNAAARWPGVGRALSPRGVRAFATASAHRVGRALVAAGFGLALAGARSFEGAELDAELAAWSAGLAVAVYAGLALLGRAGSPEPSARGDAWWVAGAIALAASAAAAATVGTQALLSRAVGGTEVWLLGGLAAATLLVLGAQRGSGVGRVGRVAVALPLMATGLLWGAAAFFPGHAVVAERPQNLLLIGVDTLRFDRTALDPSSAEVGGPPRERVTPEILRFAEAAVLFRQATAQASWTLPSFASVLTGRYPHEHGALSTDGLLEPAELTLAEILREAGYRTASIVSHTFLTWRHGMAQGFSRRDERGVRGELAITSRALTDAALEWLSGAGRGAPFFLFVHYFDPHYEYLDRPEFPFADAYRGWLRDEAPDIATLRTEAERLRPADLAYLRALYDEELAATDREIGRLLAALDADGLANRTAVVLVADHGEEFLDHDWLGHTPSLHQEVVRVPLLLRLPGVTPARHVIDEPVETRAVFATLLDHLGVDGPERGSAPSLLPLIRGEDGAPEQVYSSVWLPDLPAGSGKRARRTAVRQGRWKLIRDHDSGRDRLFDLERDPGERRIVTSAPQAAELGRALDGWFGSWPEAPGRRTSLGAAERRRLEALGYLAPEAPGSLEPEAP